MASEGGRQCAVCGRALYTIWPIMCVRVIKNNYYGGEAKEANGRKVESVWGPFPRLGACAYCVLAVCMDFYLSKCAFCRVNSIKTWGLYLSVTSALCLGSRELPAIPSRQKKNSLTNFPISNFLGFAIAD
jgi:hypothetical protein